MTSIGLPAPRAIPVSARRTGRVLWLRDRRVGALLSANR